MTLTSAIFLTLDCSLERLFHCNIQSVRTKKLHFILLFTPKCHGWLLTVIEWVGGCFTRLWTLSWGRIILTASTMSFHVTDSLLLAGSIHCFVCHCTFLFWSLLHGPIQFFGYKACMPPWVERIVTWIGLFCWLNNECAWPGHRCIELLPWLYVCRWGKCLFEDSWMSMEQWINNNMLMLYLKVPSSYCPVIPSFLVEHMWMELGQTV